jgi:hypothetical protein
VYVIVWVFEEGGMGDGELDGVRFMGYIQTFKMDETLLVLYFLCSVVGSYTAPAYLFPSFLYSSLPS